MRPNFAGFFVAIITVIGLAACERSEQDLTAEANAQDTLDGRTALMGAARIDV